ncbi:uncharacterized protein LOC115724481 [Cannabis sativa]|uniref:uncharacterized protein LOC115724481 n=1 Tax=Cannabis sativa TaxID=3483 RepID=UPI0029CAA0FF|nr:uncharacterized protein LOC115724481 [Cannabis sativa]
MLQWLFILFSFWVLIYWNDILRKYVTVALRSRPSSSALKVAISNRPATSCCGHVQDRKKYTKQGSSKNQPIHVSTRMDGVQCGYYVMKIIQSFMTVVNPASFLKNHFKLDAPYSNEEINAVRDEFAEFVKPLIID